MRKARPASPVHSVCRMPAGTSVGIVLALFLLGTVDPARAQEAADTGADPSGRRVVTFGGDRDFYPYEFLDEDGTPHGFNVDLMKELGDVQGFDVRFRMDRWTDIRRAIEVERSVDVSDMYYSEERARVVDYVDPFTVVWEEAWIRPGGPAVRGLDDLKAMRVVVHRGGFIEQFLRHWTPETVLIPVDSEIGALRELARGHGDVALVAQIIGRYARTEAEEQGLRVTGPPMLPRAYGLVVSKGNDALREDLNRGLAQLRANGTLAALERRWLSPLEGPGPFVAWLSHNLPWLFAALAILLAGWVVVLVVLRVKVRRQALALQAELAERRKTEEALRESQEEFRLAFQASPVLLGISTLDEGRYVDVNDAFEKMTGWTRAEAVGKTSRDLGLWADPEDRARALAQMTQHGHAELDVRLHLKSGEVREVMFRSDLITLRGVPCMLTSATDIHERKAWERALLDAEERWKFALEGAGDGVWDTDMSTGRMFGSRRYKEILGYRDDEWVFDPMAWDRRVFPADKDVLAKAYRDYVKGRSPLLQTEVRLVCKDGSDRWVSVRGRAASRGPDGHPTRMIGTITDISERKRAEQERDGLEDQLRQSQKMEVVGQLAGGIAHDFNNQLMVVRGYCDLLSNEALDVRSRSLLDEVVKATDRAAALTGRLLAFGRKQVRRLSVVNLNRVLDEMKGALSMMAGEAVRLDVEVAPHLGNVRADRDQIEQVIANIVVNARDAMKGGGRLTIRTRNIVLDDAYARAHVDSTPGPHVLISFQDTGVGMDEAVRLRIFEPFFTTKKEGQGSGLGLSIVYGIVKQNGGHVTVESEPGRGSTFRVYLPRVEEALHEDRAPAGGARMEPRKATVLFVEDDPHLFELLRGVLEHAGYRTLAAPVPEEALSLAAGHEGPVDLLVSDVVMPGMGGPEVYERLKAARPGVRVLFISGYPKDVLERTTVLPAGIRLLGKPFSARDLLAAIQQALEEDPPAP